MLLGRDGWDTELVKKHCPRVDHQGLLHRLHDLDPAARLCHRGECRSGAGILNDPVRLGVLLFELLFVIDVQIGTVGYLLTMRPLDAHIRSGNPYLAGLAGGACLLSAVGHGACSAVSCNTR